MEDKDIQQFQNFSSLQFITFVFIAVCVPSEFQNFSSLQFILNGKFMHPVIYKISKLFKFTVHIDYENLESCAWLFQNFSSLQFIRVQSCSK